MLQRLLYFKMRILNICLVKIAICSKIYGNIFSDSHQGTGLQLFIQCVHHRHRFCRHSYPGKVIETMWLPAAEGPDETTSCIFVEHSEFFSGTTMVKRTFTEVSTRIKWELVSGTRTELDIRYLKDKSKEENPDHIGQFFSQKNFIRYTL